MNCNPLVSVIIVGYNSAPDLPELFHSLQFSSYSNLHIFYIDNSSSDNSPAIVKRIAPKCTVVINRNNLGFAQANNIGIRLALNYNSNYIFLLNPDTIIDPNCIKILVEQSNQNTILQPLILIHRHNHKTSLINTTGISLNYLGFSHCDNYQSNLSKVKGMNNSLLGASGAGMFIPSNIIKKIGLFNENYFLYYEDLDFSWRAVTSGYKILLTPEAKVWHKYKFNPSPNRWYHTELSRLIFFFTNFQLKTIVVVSPVFIVTELLTIIYSIRSKFFSKKIHSYVSFLYHLPSILNFKFKVQQQRILNDSQLTNKLKDHLYFSEVKIPGIKLYNYFVSHYYKYIYSKLL